MKRVESMLVVWQGSDSCNGLWAGELPRQIDRRTVPFKGRFGCPRQSLVSRGCNQSLLFFSPVWFSHWRGWEFLIVLLFLYWLMNVTVAALNATSHRVWFQKWNFFPMHPPGPFGIYARLSPGKGTIYILGFAFKGLQQVCAKVNFFPFSWLYMCMGVLRCMGPDPLWKFSCKTWNTCSM